MRLAVSKVWSITSHEFRDTDDSLKARGFNDSVTFPTNADYSNERQILICNLCGNAYSWISSLRRHQLQCGNKEAKISCDFCAKKFYRRDRLKEHLFVYHSDVISECRTRPTKVAEYSIPRLIVKKIEKLQYAKKPMIYKCTRCTKSYQLETSLRRHQRLECGIEPKHECLMCGKKFTYKFMLTHHLVSCKKKTASKEMF
ncbi:zinc finger protein 91-like [Temnothorax curvispinosus]|uniref:Zinc finger protein 91-like n=1 Tax=Temnothorax curvispinosus TaxID=300111 RepID=A0A6J1PG94_9HYME|nr:zinc finger protein 91-like [Temnothorax curvispinosus]